MRATFMLVITALLACGADAVRAAPPDSTTDDPSLEALLNRRVVAASKYEQAVRDAAASVTIITAQDIERYGYRTVEDVLRAVRGFYVTNDRNYSYAGVRGFSRPGDYNNRILLLLDGHTLNDDVYGSAQTGTEMGGIDFGTVERIEIVRGPSSALYGASAMLAVVNIVTRDAKASTPARLALESGSYGLFRGAASAAKTFQNGISFNVAARAANVDGTDLYYREYDSPLTNRGVSEGLDWDKYYGFTATLACRDVEIEAMLTSREKGIPTGAWGVDFNNDHARTIDQHAFVEARYKPNVGASGGLRMRAYADAYSYEGTYPTSGVDSYDGSDGRWIGAELQYRWDVRANHRLIVGGEGQNHLRADYRVWDATDSHFNRDEPYTVLSAYVQDEYQPTDYLSLVAGVRFDRYSARDGSTSPRAGILVNPAPSTAVKLLYGEAFRVPTFYEKYFEDAPGRFRASPGLDPEWIRTYELLWEQQLRRHCAGVVSLYQNDFHDLIDLVVDPADSSLQHRNVSGARARGVEFGLRGAVWRINGYGSYAFQDAENTNDGSRLTNSPASIAKIGVELPFARHMSCAVESQYETGRKTVYGGKTGAFMVMNLRLASVFQPRGRQTSASLQLRNVFDTSYETPGGYEHVQPAIAQDGRTLLFAVEARF